MPLTREQKKEVVADLRKKIDQQNSITFIDFKGLGVKDFTKLRKKLKKIGAGVKVAKKTLARIAFKQAGLEFKDFEGQLALVFGFKDKIKPLKATYEISTQTDMEILGGLFDKKFIGKEKMIELAKLPSRKELLAQFIYSLASPLSGFINTLQGNIKGLVYTLNKIKSKKS